MQSNRRQEASEILLSLSLRLEPRLKPLASWFHSTYATIEKWHSAEGNNGVKRAKEILLNGWLNILGEKTTPLSFVKAVDGIPELVRPLVLRVKRMKYDARLLSVVLSWVRMTDLFMGQPTDATVTPTLEVINDSKLPATAKPIIDEFNEFVRLFHQTYPEHPLFNRFFAINGKPTETSVRFFSESAGPNGKLVYNAHKDIKTLSKQPTSKVGVTLLDALVELSEACCELDKFSWKPNLAYTRKVLQSDEVVDYSDSPGKLGFIPEKSAKVRVIAQPDYYTQYELRPISQALFAVLGGLEEDHTFDQRAAIPSIVRWQTEGRYVASFDQTSCTDLFPFELQKCYLRELYGHRLCEAVSTVLVDRDWSVKLPSGRVRRVRWSVGQPMGAFASWPLMACTHHLLVQYAHWVSTGRRKANWAVFKNYVICGDDIVIADRRVAESYRKICTRLGMKINLAKSHISGGGTGIDPVSEFTKVTVWKGQPLFPIKPHQVLSSVKDWRMAIPLFSDLASHPGFQVSLKTLEWVVKKYYTKRSNTLLPLLTLPTEFGGLGYRTHEPLRKSFDLLQTSEIHPMLYYIALRIRKSLLSAKRDASPLEDIPIALLRESPAYEIYRDTDDPYAPGVPGTHEIVNQLLLNGFQGYEYLIESWFDVPQLPFSKTRERELKRNLTLWEQASRIKHHVQSESYSVLTESSLRSDDPVFLAWEHSGFSDPCVAAQYGRVAEFMTLRRQATANPKFYLRWAAGLSSKVVPFA